MCHYCGCRQIPLIRDYVAEHDRATVHGDNALRALDQSDPAGAKAHLEAMARELESHWRGEENGLFAIMRREAAYAEHISPLVAEHRELAQLLGSVDLADPVDQQRVRDAVAELAEHISKEEDGLFPMSLIELSGAEWDTAMAAWEEAHPGEVLIED